MKIKFSPEKLFWQLATLIALFILLGNPLKTAWMKMTIGQDKGIAEIVRPVEAKEIYEMFTCPCCSQPLKKEEPCCGAMTQMIDFIDRKINSGAGKNEVILATAQEYGLERLADESERLALREQLISKAPKNAPKISVSQTKKDLGKVSLKNGVVNSEFIIKNEGKSDLVIDKLSSSCGCTSASLIYKGGEGPRFYMAGHGNKEPDADWKAAIPAGDEATIKVYYDPAVHPDLTGPVTRTVSVHSNDPVDFETKLTITLEQTK